MEKMNKYSGFYSW